LTQDFCFWGGGEEEEEEKKRRGVSHCSLAIYIKIYLKAKEDFFGNSNYFTMQKYNLQKIL